MSKFARKRIQKMTGNGARLFLRLSFRLAVLLWFWEVYSPTDGIGDLILDGIIAVLLAALTFEWVALGLCSLLIQVRNFLAMIRGQ